MKPSYKTMIHFYQQIGKIFYCIAISDKIVREEEIFELKKIVKTHWLSLENTFDEFGSDSAFQIEIVFDWMIENNWDSEQILADFKIFKKEHQSLFTEQVKELIMKTGDSIANSFLGKNKSESAIIMQLKGILE